MKPVAIAADGTELFDAPPDSAGLSAEGVPLYNPPTDQPFEFSGTEMVKNIPGSAGQAASQFWDAITSPVETATGLKNLAFGLAQKLWPGEQDHEKYADAVGQLIVDRYGSSEAALKSLQNDPVGVLLDVSSLVTGGSGLIRGGAKVAGLNRTAEIAGKVQAVADPFNMAKRGIQKGVSYAKAKGAPAEMYLNATKPSTTLSDADRAKAAATALEKQIMPTPAGMRKLDKMMVGFGREIDRLLTQAEATGKKVHFSEVVKPVRDLKAKWKQSPNVGMDDNIAKMDATMNAWRDQLKRQNNMFLSPKQLQDIKTDLYKQINFDRSQQKASLPVEETKKALARGTRESIEGITPDIKDVNRNYGELEHLRGVLDRPVSRIQNRDMMGIGVPIKMSAGSLLTGDYGLLGGAFGGVLGAMDAPTNKARAALALHRWRNNPMLTPSNFPLGLGLYQAGGLPTE